MNYLEIKLICLRFRIKRPVWLGAFIHYEDSLMLSPTNIIWGRKKKKQNAYTDYLSASCNGDRLDGEIKS